jgi:hypothetical protein
MTQQHTPAPCKHNETPQMGMFNIEDTKGDIIAKANKEEDAVLYAAAPELLEALKYSLKILAAQEHIADPHLEPIRAAIAKAEGK